MNDLFASKPRLCSCRDDFPNIPRAVRVDTSDRIEANQRQVTVHGLDHCFTYPREARP